MVFFFFKQSPRYISIFLSIKLFIDSLYGLNILNCHPCMWFTGIYHQYCNNGYFDINRTRVIGLTKKTVYRHTITISNNILYNSNSIFTIDRSRGAIRIFQIKTDLHDLYDRSETRRRGLSSVLWVIVWPLRSGLFITLL